MEKFHHVSVMANEVINALGIKPDGVYVDATVGGAGHASKIASLLSERGRIICIDQDEDAIFAARSRLSKFSCGLDIVRDNFQNIFKILKNFDTMADGILFDLGVSSHQIDTAERGFSYMNDAPLDMRMDRRKSLTAYDVVNFYDEKKLIKIFSGYGEERYARRIVREIAKSRAIKPIRTTGELSKAVRDAIPAAALGKSRGHPAKRVFQAIRIEVNGELEILEKSVRDAVECLTPGGRIAVIAFHSLEDRIVKKTFAALAKGCVCPPDFPACVCGLEPRIYLQGKGIKPKADEISANPRAKSATLRVAIRAEGGKGYAFERSPGGLLQGTS